MTAEAEPVTDMHKSANSIPVRQRGHFATSD